ncbi:MAG: DNA mismatch repair endonuclease MutL [Limosilactobacillus oris]|uniref:DNA mismatch repair endonuclease MutL n=1 Tax=Megasphaera sp. TaxID=2023260 RepID=UPI0025C3DEE5|nr:DNA mismatch repair endonuclease MutL [Megasphaera sp.]MCH3902813.1 DNA mismatch repair endonuclease MutL [Limosilactobacillus oris]MCH3932129.1 DNA mismatch repair endonuclease MutL [Megasphaera sp.]MCI1887708.1 DNA mismatch repair endonuclease MutL [Sporolactobacillus sp.]MCI1905541.1 DNA mismatch repair endonuclease MutL [Enterococcaceae bacterium]
MSSIIHVLDEATRNKIAAGEVVERPASCIKELVENAIDAGAHAIEVEIADGGQSYMRVTDDGCGMSPEDAHKCIIRHGTSKISSVEDIFAITSLGFRGEAVPSIAAVSHMQITTRQASDDFATHLILDGGEITAEDQAGAPVGTTMEVSDLFYNTPARRKFLKSERTESSKISEMVTKLALANPAIAFTFTNNGRTTMKTGGTGDLRETVANIYGANVARDVFAVTADQDGISLEGYVGKPSVLKSNRNWQTCIVNHRIVHNPLMFKAIDNAYHAMLPKSGYPFAMLHLHVDPATIDVNVHPAKTEIKFSDEQAVYRAIYHSIVTALVAQEKPEAIAKTIGDAVGAVPEGGPQQVHVGAPTWGARSQESGQATSVGAVPKGGPQQVHVGAPTWGARSQESGQATSVGAVPKGGPQQAHVGAPTWGARSQESGQATSVGAVPKGGPQWEKATSQSATRTAPLSGEPLADGSSLFSQALAQHGQGGPSEATSVVSEASAPKIVFDGDDDVFIPLGEVADCFIIAKKGQDLYIVDQHAAHERIRYDTFCKRVERMPSQQLLTPEFVEVDNEDMTLLLERQDVFNDLGYTYSEAGPTTLRVEEVPCDLQTSDIADSLKDICLLLHDQKEPDKAMVRHRSLAYLSCHGAVKAGDSLNIRQMKQLLDDLFHTEKPYVCPHGRPTIIRFTPKELAHLFKRT